jgi:hypothetical protein
MLEFQPCQEIVLVITPQGRNFGGLMTDFTFSPADFSATEITVVANTPDGKKYLAERYGFACVSINIRKSAAPDLADSFEFQGLSYS